jgi:heptosyltransferase-3
LHAAFPDVEIGYVAGSWSMPVLKGHPMIAHLHCIDVPIRNRSQQSDKEKKERYDRQRAQAIEEIREIGYDWAIALNAWTPDFLDIAWRSGIPVRAAYRRHLLSLLATHLADSPETQYLRAEGACQEDLLRALGVDESALQKRHAYLAPSSEEATLELQSIFVAKRLKVSRYFVVHMGAGAEVREMPTSFWRQVAEHLSTKGVVIFTGYSEREARNIDAVIAGITNCVNAAGQLSWDGFVATVRQARAVFSVDTSICHVAAAVNTPLIAVYTGITGVGRWRAEGNSVCIWTNHVPCSPCALPDGCPEMKCLDGIRPAHLTESWAWIESKAKVRPDALFSYVEGRDRSSHGTHDNRG